jgi:DNA-binding CsgD family transcriptional regulator
MTANVIRERKVKFLHDILALNNIRVEYSHLMSFLDKTSIHEDKCFFLYDLISDKCRYSCPSISNILGYDHRRYQNKGFLFFKTIIHPIDFPFFIEEILTLVKSAEKGGDEKVFTGNSSGLTIRIKHRNGEWLKTKVFLIYLKETNCGVVKILLGFIEKDVTSLDNYITTPALITSREKEVFRYLSVGNSAKMIADKLSISENTVITHRKNLIQKLQVKNSAEMITRGLELNILNTPPIFT